MNQQQRLSETRFDLGAPVKKPFRWKVILTLFLISLPFDLNLIWSFTGIAWLYWLSWFLLDAEQIIDGILLIFFPGKLQRFYGNKADIRVSILLILLGIYFCSRGSESLYFLVNRWLTECMNIAECLR